MTSPVNNLSQIAGAVSSGASHSLTSSTSQDKAAKTALPVLQGNVSNTPPSQHNFTVQAAAVPDKIQHVFAMRVYGNTYTSPRADLDQQNKLNEKFHNVKTILQENFSGSFQDRDMDWSSLTIFTDRMTMRYLVDGKRVEKSLLTLVDQPGDAAHKLADALEELDAVLRDITQAKHHGSHSLSDHARRARTSYEKRDASFRPSSLDSAYVQNSNKRSFTLQDRIKTEYGKKLSCKDVVKRDDLHFSPTATALQGRPEVQKRLANADAIVDALNQLPSTPNTPPSSEERLFLAELENIDTFALTMALTYYPTEFNQSTSEAEGQEAINKKVQQLKAEVERIYSEKCNEHKKELQKTGLFKKEPKLVQPYEKDYAADVASLIFSGDHNNERSATLYQSFASGEHQTLRARSLIDAVMYAVVQSENPSNSLFNAGAIAQEIKSQALQELRPQQPSP